MYFENTPFYVLWNSRASTKSTWCILGQFRKNCWPPPPLSFTWGDMKFTKIHLYTLQFTLIFFIKFYCKAMHIFSRLLLYQHRQYTHQYNLYKTWVQSNEIRQKKTNFSKGLRLCLTPIVLNLRRQIEWLKQKKMIIKSHTKLLQFQNYQC